MLLSRRLVLHMSMLLDFHGATAQTPPNHSTSPPRQRLRPPSAEASGAMLATGTLGTAESLNHGIIGYWDANTISGTTVPDLSRHGQNGTINGPINRVRGRFGSALHLHGAPATAGVGGTYIKLSDGDGAMSSYIGPITVVLWASPDVVVRSPQTSGYVFIKSGGLYVFQYGAQYGSRFVNSVGEVNHSTDADTVINLVAGHWGCSTLTFAPGSPNAMAAFLDGIGNNTTAPHGTLRNIANWSFIGSDYLNPGYYGFTGGWEIAIVYDRVLTARDIATLAGGYRPKIG